MTGLDRVRHCGSTTFTGTGGPTIRITDGGTGRIAGYSGLTTCGSIWACVVCAAKVAARRADELGTVIRKVLAEGGSASLVTLTMRHNRSDRLAACWDAAGYAWSRVTSGKKWMADQEAGGLLGWVRVVEVTHGAAGWHVHVHALLCWDRPVSLEWAEQIGARMWQRWSNALERKGFESWADSGGMDVRMASANADNLGDYFTKLAREVTSSYAKEGHAGGRTPFQLLAEAVEGVADDIHRWWEFETASRDRRQLTWSRGGHDLRAWAGLGRERTDQEIAEEELQGDDVLALPVETWEAIRRTPLAVQLLDVAERGGLVFAQAWLNERGLAWDVARWQRPSGRDRSRDAGSAARPAAPRCPP